MPAELAAGPLYPERVKRERSPQRARPDEIAICDLTNDDEPVWTSKKRQVDVVHLDDAGHT